MKKITLTTLFLLIATVFITGCTKEKKVINCEELNATQCNKYAEQCKVCPDFINSENENCHAVAFCRNFDNLDNKTE